MKKNALKFLSLAVLVCMLSFAGIYDVCAGEKTIAPNEAIEFSKQAELVTQLVSLGESKKDPIILLSAVKVLEGIPAGVLKPGEKDKNGARYERESLLKQAKQYASEDKELIDIISKIEAIKGDKGYYVPTCIWQWVCVRGLCYYEYVCW